MNQDNNFYSALTYLYDIHGIELKEDIFESMGTIAWRKIGNNRYKTYQVQLVPSVDPANNNSYSNANVNKFGTMGGWYVDLPCNVGAIESVTANYEDYQKTSSTQNFPGILSLPTENQIEFEKYGTNELYMSGKLLNYSQVGDRLYFTEPYTVVNVLYKGYYLDEEGLPYLTEKEVEAVAKYCAYAETYKKGIQTRDAGTIQIAKMLEQDWTKACSAARIPKDISENDMSNILDVMTSWDRKRFGKSFKPIK
jgi:hypothetical protein